MYYYSPTLQLLLWPSSGCFTRIMIMELYKNTDFLHSTLMMVTKVTETYRLMLIYD